MASWVGLEAASVTFISGLDSSIRDWQDSSQSNHRGLEHFQNRAPVRSDLYYPILSAPVKYNVNFLRPGVSASVTGTKGVCRSPHIEFSANMGSRAPR